MCMFSTRELTLRGTKFDVMKNYKNALHATMLPENRVVRLKSSTEREMPLLFFMNGMYLDLNSHSIVIDADVLPVASELQPIGNAIAAVDITLNDDEMKFWRAALPPMVERCRNWDHAATCEYKSAAPVSLQKTDRSICTCGIGKVANNFPAGEWNMFLPHVPRVAISPIFVPAHMVPTRTFFQVPADRAWEELGAIKYFAPITDETDIEN